MKLVMVYVHCDVNFDEIVLKKIWKIDLSVNANSNCIEPDVLRCVITFI